MFDKQQRGGIEQRERRGTSAAELCTSSLDRHLPSHQEIKETARNISRWALRRGELVLEIDSFVLVRHHVFGRGVLVLIHSRLLLLCKKKKKRSDTKPLDFS